MKSTPTSTVTLGDHPATFADVVAVSRHGAEIRISDAARARIAKGHAAVEKLAKEGAAIYGVTTGLGAAVDTRIALDSASTQVRVPRARLTGIGPGLATESVRAMMFARLAGFACGVSGASVAAADIVAEFLNRRVHPVIPAIGSIGEGDLIPLAHMAAVAFGEGRAEFGGEIVPGGEALRRAGIAPLRPGAKDGLALVGTNAAIAGIGALVLDRAAVSLEALVAASSLSFEAYRSSISPLDPDALACRQMPGQAEIAAAMRALFEGGDICKPGSARRLQDPLSFRCVAPVHGAALDALRRAQAIIGSELNASNDNPAFVNGRSVPNANFDSTHAALAMHGLTLSIAYVAAAAGERVMKLMSPSSSDLPRFLSPIQQGRNGFATVQKTISALVAEIQYRATPAPVVIQPVADRVEDYGTMALALVERCGEAVERLRWLVAIELVVAAQACDLRQDIELGSGTAKVHAAVRAVVPRLDDDRPTTPDIECISDRIDAGAFAVPSIRGG